MVALDPAVGSEANKTRPAVVVSNNRANAGSERRGCGVITVVPLTGNVAKVFPFQTVVGATESGLRVDSKAQAEQVRSVSVTRVGRVVGRVPVHRMVEIEGALRRHLQL